jgi:hypothetical protein
MGKATKKQKKMLVFELTMYRLLKLDVFYCSNQLMKHTKEILRNKRRNSPW